MVHRIPDSICIEGGIARRLALPEPSARGSVRYIIARPFWPMGKGLDETMAAEHDGVGTQLAFALYGAANRVIRLHKPFLEPLGLTFPQYLVILELLNGAPRTVGELCARLGMDTGTLTPLLKRLQVAGMVTRTRDMNDERRVLIDVTEASRAIESEIRGVNGRIRSACQLTEDDLQGLRRTLEGLGYPATS